VGDDGLPILTFFDRKETFRFNLQVKDIAEDEYCADRGIKNTWRHKRKWNRDADVQAEFIEYLAAYVAEASCLRHLDISGMNIKEHLVKLLVTDGIRKGCCMHDSKLQTVGLSDLHLSANAKDFIIQTLCPEGYAASPDGKQCKLNAFMKPSDMKTLEDDVKSSPGQTLKHTSVNPSVLQRISFGRQTSTQDVLILTRDVTSAAPE